MRRIISRCTLLLYVRQEKHIYINTIMKPQWADECMTSNAVD